MPIRFSPFTTYVTATSAANNHITVGSTDGLILGQPIQFSGVSLGGLVLNNTYYVLSIVDSTNITISNVYPGVIHPVLTDAGFATLTSFNATPFLATSLTADRKKVSTLHQALVSGCSGLPLNAVI